jgi:hypothetical protein
VATFLDDRSIPDIGSRVTGCQYVNCEKVFHETWIADHEHKDLSQLLMSRPDKKNEKRSWMFWYQPSAFILTYRERVIMSTLIQWLGTNIGFDFLRRALKKCGYEIREIQ